eukprot:6309448-Amphidinium_carterae.2
MLYKRSHPGRVEEWNRHESVSKVTDHENGSDISNAPSRHHRPKELWQPVLFLTHPTSIDSTTAEIKHKTDLHVAILSWPFFKNIADEFFAEAAVTAPSFVPRRQQAICTSDNQVSRLEMRSSNALRSWRPACLSTSSLAIAVSLTRV